MSYQKIDIDKIVDYVMSLEPGIVHGVNCYDCPYDCDECSKENYKKDITEIIYK